MIRYFTFSISIAFISWVVGIVLNALFSKTNLYQKYFLNLNFIKNERINGLLGLELFKSLIMHSFFKFFNPKLSIKKKILPSELNGYRTEMTLAENNHLFAFMFMLFFSVFRTYQGLYLFALVILLVNMLMNLYPVLLQQQNKRRIDGFFIIQQLRSGAA